MTDETGNNMRLNFILDLKPQFRSQEHLRYLFLYLRNKDLFSEIHNDDALYNFCKYIKYKGFLIGDTFESDKSTAQIGYIVIKGQVTVQSLNLDKFSKNNSNVTILKPYERMESEDLKDKEVFFKENTDLMYYSKIIYSQFISVS